MSRPVTPQEEGRNQVGEDFFWNESWYFDFFAADGSLGGYVRCGLYPNWDNRVWHTAFIVRPGNTSIGVVDYAAPMPSGEDLELSTDVFRARLSCPEPLSRWHLEMEGTGRKTADPSRMYKGDGEETPVSWNLDWHTAGKPYRYPGSTGLTRYEVPSRVEGEVSIDGTTVRISGGGQRDHSYGERGGWWRYSWMWAGFELEDGSRVHCNAVYSPSGRQLMGVGYVQTSEEFVALSDVTVETERGAEGLPRRARAYLEPAGMTVTVEPIAWGVLALPGPKGEISHFERAMARFSAVDGRSGLGWVEWNTPQPAA